MIPRKRAGGDRAARFQQRVAEQTRYRPEPDVAAANRAVPAGCPPRRDAVSPYPSTAGVAEVSIIAAIITVQVLS
jgi:hypothetical protein